ncbi:phosphoribosyl 1,2-cyclic phosphodiesterase [Zhengella mangrovi]|uniref:Phosphoribosyl 1,2-cyclic phosphodiesterase n=1 Tax=Zhengella mangrovi TaxID=1982044 RepID=A0A2G1QK82_9HYPH|nr:MBL fold metallo-hydrolase [Zhengella mangrovi]PHP65860.1 phosphoribosyl 1,2-cyclic phosphodiesterase [Zhengella mangrovi]
MADTLRFTILGCGSSPGVPRISGDWGACDPHNPKNRRTRASALVERISDAGITRVVIDTGPDFREQMVRAGADTLDGAVYTHPHADHIHGIDDLRGYVITQRKLMDIWADEATKSRLMEAFGYCFRTPEGSSYPPILRANPIRHYEPFQVTGAGGPITFEPLRQVHGDIHSLAFRIGDLAYCSDVSAFPEKTLERLDNLEFLVIDALQYRRHPSHFSLGEALDWIDRLKPGRAVLTHMHVPLDHATVMAETPHNVEPAHDGLVFEFSMSSGTVGESGA